MTRALRGGVPSRLAAGLVRVVAAGLLAVTACSDVRDTRPDAGTPTGRRDVGLGRSDTSSLVTPLRGERLHRAARMVGGVATVQWECASCHTDAHDVDVGRGPGPSATCVQCHASAHEPMQAFYAGAVSGTPVPPDTMFVARVACTGCHADTTFAVAAGAARLAALDRNCTSCHGARFGGMLAVWQRGIDWRQQAVTAYVTQAASDRRLDGAAALPARVAADAMAFLRAAGGLHNIRGADRIFRTAVDSAVAAYTRAGIGAPARPALGPDPARNGCLACHYGAETIRGTAFGEVFDHASHVVRADIACTDCHSDAMYFVAGVGADAGERDRDPRHGRTTVSAGSCASCHHTRAVTATACASCHQAGEIAGTRAVATSMRVAPNATRERDLPFRHEQHGEVRCESCHVPSVSMAPTGASCASCHAPHHVPDATCRGCHVGVKQHHTRQAHVGCAGCHDATKVASLQPTRPVCEGCHVDMLDHNPGRACTQCHQVAWRPAASVRRSP